MRLHRKLHWRIVLAYTGLIVTSLAVISVFLVDFVRGTYLDDLELRLEHEASLLSEATVHFLSPEMKASELQSASERIGGRIGARVTIIAQDGQVLADTWEDASTMENHGDRPEVLAASSAGLGKDTRLSSTVHRDMIYTAVPIVEEEVSLGIARVAVPTSQIHSNLIRIIITVSASAVFVAFLSIVMGYFIARRTSRSVRSVAEAARHIGSGDFQHRVEDQGSDETQELAGAFNRMAAALRDMVQDLSSERAKLSAILNTMADGVVVVDGGGNTTLINQAAESLFDISGKQTDRVPFIEAVADHELRDLVIQCRDTGELRFAEIELLRPQRFISAIAIPLASERAGEVLLTLHDLTRLRQVETTRREFVSNVSHELRNPLAAAKALVETLESGALSDVNIAEDFLSRVHREIDRMSSMVDDMLQLSRLDTGQVQTNLRPVDLAPVALDAMNQFQERAQERNIALDMTLSPGLPLILGDSELIRQVFVNLIDNAIRFTPDSGKITVGAEAEGGLVDVYVQDNGAGIGEEHLPHLFERFYKVDRSRGDTGTGLGLAIVKHIVESLGGEVQAASQLGVGSTFSFSLRRTR